MALSLTSSAFVTGGRIPERYTCDGENVSPPLAISGAPDGTRSFALVMDDPDIPQAVKEARGIEVFDHWVIYAIPAHTVTIPEGSVPGALGLNSSGIAAYAGPCPPPQYEPKEHRYVFMLYALSEEPFFPEAPSKRELLAAIAPCTLEAAQLTGRYSRA